GWMVALYVHHHFTGDTAILTADTPYVGDVINDQISSIEVADGPRAIIFQHSNYSGNAKLLGLGQYDVNELGIGNDQLSSLRVPKGWEVVLYQHHNFTGAKRAYTADTPYVGDEFNDQTSSIIVKLAS
ncbi:MAG: hypothetical protein FJ125_12865, partial [Deltaproteobacteria bacterium]|nr:hypothetical protein [Deltaproteobacteria bacterium]